MATTSRLILLALAAIAVFSIAYLSYDPHRHLCATSPDPSHCRAVIAPLAGSSSFPLQLVDAIVDESRHKLVAARGAVLRSNAGGGGVRPALADCLELLDLADGYLAEAGATAAGEDKRTWLSAALTVYSTCLDGIAAGGGPAPEEVAGHLNPLRSLASASLAVLTSSSSPAPAVENQIATVVDALPSWLSVQDRRLLSATAQNVGLNADTVVAKDGSGKFTTVQAAVDAAPKNPSKRYVIYIKAGVYKENVDVKNKKNLMLAGDGMDKTVITGSRNVVDGSTTFNSATLAAASDGIMLQDLKVENTAGPEKHQAVALRVTADKAVINRCRLDGFQDTLYTHTLRQFYRDSAISGTVDFIFGNAAVVFQNCVLTARRPMASQQNAVTAQGREDPNQNTGTSVQQCRIVPSPELAPVVGSFPTYLGRPWKQYSRTVFMQSFLDSHIAPAGWLEWDGQFALSTLYYGEYANSGPGGKTNGRVNWPGYHVITNAGEASKFTVGQFIQGGEWLLGTGVPFSEGL